jgi:hypothetical protein
MIVLRHEETGEAIGAYRFPDRKKPCLCVRKGGSIRVYGTFNNDGAADDFMNVLAEFFGVKEKEE